MDVARAGLTEKFYFKGIDRHIGGRPFVSVSFFTTRQG
jgi:hypothetical protein